MPRSNFLARLAIATLLSSIGCAHTKGRNDAELSRHPDGVPVLRMEIEALEQQLQGPVAVNPDELETWRDIGTSVGTIDGEKVLVLSHWLFGTEEGKVRSNQRAVMHRNRRDALVKLFTGLAGHDLPDFVPEPPAYQREAVRKSKLYHLAWCDAACFATYAAQAGVKATLDDAAVALTDKRTRERAEAAKRDRRQLLERTFRDTDPRLWKGNQPWWLSHTASLVEFIDDEVVLIGVGLFTSDEPAGPHIRNKTAGGRARAELGRAFRVLVERQAAATGREITTSSDIGVTGSTVIGLFERGNETWALALCDQICMKETAEVNEVDFDGTTLQPGDINAAPAADAAATAP